MIMAVQLINKIHRLLENLRVLRNIKHCIPKCEHNLHWINTPTNCRCTLLEITMYRRNLHSFLPWA